MAARSSVKFCFLTKPRFISSRGEGEVQLCQLSVKSPHPLQILVHRCLSSFSSTTRQKGNSDSSGLNKNEEEEFPHYHRDANGVGNNPNEGIDNSRRNTNTDRDRGPHLRVSESPNSTFGSVDGNFDAQPGMRPVFKKTGGLRESLSRVVIPVSAPKTKSLPKEDEHTLKPTNRQGSHDKQSSEQMEGGAFSDNPFFESSGFEKGNGFEDVIETEVDDDASDTASGLKKASDLNKDSPNNPDDMSYRKLESLFMFVFDKDMHRRLLYHRKMRDALRSQGAFGVVHVLEEMIPFQLCNTTSINFAIKLLASYGHGSDALKVYSLFGKLGLHPDIYSHVSLLTAFSKSENPGVFSTTAEEVFRNSAHYRFPMNKHCANAYLAFCVAAKLYPRSDKIFEYIKRLGPPDRFSIGNILKRCAETGDIELAASHLQYAESLHREKVVQFNSGIYSIYLNVLRQALRNDPQVNRELLIKKAFSSIGRMKTFGVTMDIEYFNNLIWLIYELQPEGAAELIQKRLLSLLPSFSLLYCSLAIAVSKGNNQTEAKHFFDKIKLTELHPRFFPVYVHAAVAADGVQGGIAAIERLRNERGEVVAIAFWSFMTQMLETEELRDPALVGAALSWFSSSRITLKPHQSAFLRKSMAKLPSLETLLSAFLDAQESLPSSN